MAKKQPDRDGTVFKRGTCKSLQQTSTLGYEISVADSKVSWRITSSTGNGYFSDKPVALDAIIQILEQWQEKYGSITSLTLRQLYAGTSVNTASFMLATLIQEGLLEPHPDRKRHYQLTDVDAFRNKMTDLASSHSASGKANPKAREKAGSRMPKGRKKVTQK